MQNKYQFTKRDYFMQELNKFQGVNNIDVPVTIIEIIKKDLDKLDADIQLECLFHDILEGYNKLYPTVSYYSIKRVLRDNKLSKYYDKIPAIITLLTGQQPIKLSKEQLEKTIKYFEDNKDRYRYINIYKRLLNHRPTAITLTFQILLIFLVHSQHLRNILVFVLKRDPYLTQYIACSKFLIVLPCILLTITKFHTHYKR